MLLVMAVLGVVPLRRLSQADAALHARFANTPRKRKPHIIYPIEPLS
ncbi:MAG TPA: hypothetical protein VGF36_11630 [Rhodopila sp.]